MPKSPMKRRHALTRDFQNPWKIQEKAIESSEGDAILKARKRAELKRKNKANLR